MYDVRFTGAKLQKNGQSAKRKPKFFFLFPKPRFLPSSREESFRCPIISHFILSFGLVIQ